MLPGVKPLVGYTKVAVGDSEVKVCIQREKQFSISIAVASSKLSQHSVPNLVIAANACVKVSENNKFVRR